MRSIAADAEVDTALVSYYFGSKQGVFGAAMALTANPAQVLAAALLGDLWGLPERVLRALLRTWDDEETGAPLRAMLAVSARIRPLPAWCAKLSNGRSSARSQPGYAGAIAKQRAAAFGAALAGLIFGRYVLRLGRW